MRLYNKFVYSALLPVAFAFQRPAASSRHFFFASAASAAAAAAAAAASATSPSSSTTVLSSTAKSASSTASTSSTEDDEIKSFINRINIEYEELHKAFELQFWGTKMNLSNDDGDDSNNYYSVSKLTKTKGEMENFLADETKLIQVRQYLDSTSQSNLDPMIYKTLKMLERTFGCYIMESEEAKILRGKATEIEGRLESSRNNLVLGATIDGKFEELSSVGLRSKMRVHENENVRKACFEGLTKIGDFVCSNGFVELVKTRNRMAKSLGYQDYYDYKVTQAEGFGKDELFHILDTLEEGTRDVMIMARQQFVDSKKGGGNESSALDPWNISYLMAGDVTRKMDQYFPFEKSVEQWGRSFAALNINYRGAKMDLDLLDRKRKYSNGFCHWPQPAWVKPDGTFQPATTHFTSLADPSAVGSGLTGLTTLMHEAGHAAHFANIEMPSPLFSQERAPTSVPYAELQSMFLDSLVGDAAWRAKYALSRESKPLPWNIHEEDVQSSHPYKVFALRAMIAVPYFEKALYEMSDDEINEKSIKQLANKIERDIQGGLSPRPLLSVPHLLSDEASCYYHGYVLAEMAVHQTRQFFMDRDGYIVDNPKVGPTLTEQFWKPGNSESFLSLVENCTGKPLTGDSWIDVLKQDIDELLKEEKVAYDKAIADSASSTCKNTEDGDATDDEDVVDLDMRIRIVDGDKVLADTSEDGSFLATCHRFEKYVRENYAAPTV